MQNPTTQRGGLDPLMTVGEVAEYLRIPQATLYGYRTRGGGPTAIKVGRHLRYRRSDVEAWLNEHVTFAEAGR